MDQLFFYVVSLPTAEAGQQLQAEEVTKHLETVFGIPLKLVRDSGGHPVRLPMKREIFLPSSDITGM